MIICVIISFCEGVILGHDLITIEYIKDYNLHGTTRSMLENRRENARYCNSEQIVVFRLTDGPK